MSDDRGLEREILKDKVKKYLMDLIMTGHFEPGDRLVEIQLAKDLKVSQAPVREALCDLQQMGIVYSERFKGTYVRKFSLDELKDVYDVRAELEGLAIRNAVYYITDQEIDQLEMITKQMRDAAKAGDLLKQISLDNEFHERVMILSRNQILERVWRSLFIVSWTILGIYRYKYDKVQLADRHLPILEAVKKRDAVKAEEEMQKHFIELKDLV
ncbi:MAG: GntR family transcriptional regulator [Dehalobacterium sp.]